MKQAKTTKQPLEDGKKVIKAFWTEVNQDGKLLRQKNKRDALGQHTSDIRNAFANFIDQLHRSGAIADDLANSITLN